MSHALVLGNDCGVEHRALVRSVFNGVLDGLVYQAFHALAMLFGHCFVLIGDERFQQVGVIRNTFLRGLEHLLEFRIGCLGRDLLECPRHLVVGRPQVLELTHVKVGKIRNIGHDFSFS